VDPYASYTIEALANRAYGGGELAIVDTLERNDHFARYLIAYPSDGLTIYGFMNVPNEGSKFPMALVLHGFIPPAEYKTLAYTRRYADALAEAGYFVIHPNFRNYPPSDSGPDAFRSGFAVDVLNLIAIIRTQSQDAEGVLRRADADNIHLWGHSMGGGVALRVVTVNNAPYVKSAVLYGSMSGDESLNYERIRQWSNNSNGQFELAANAETLAAISPIEHLERINAAISIHHSDADERVPVAWSQDLCARMEALDHALECFIYNGAPHTFIPPWDTVFIERVNNFFARY
jgi:dipeptidyl aminopeptidase/acylaminoacyl peptidase